jgi:hypothetical protein
MATWFNDIINVDIRDSVPDWTPFEDPPGVLSLYYGDREFGEGQPYLDLEREAAAMLARE